MKFVLSRCSTHSYTGGRKGWLHVYYLYASLIWFIFVVLNDNCHSFYDISVIRRHLEHLCQKQQHSTNLTTSRLFSLSEAIIKGDLRRPRVKSFLHCVVCGSFLSCSSNLNRHIGWKHVKSQYEELLSLN